MDMDMKLLALLEKCNCWCHYRCFQGVTLTGLRDLPVKALNMKLALLLSSVADGQSLASKLAASIVNYVENDPDATGGCSNERPKEEDMLTDDIRPTLEYNSSSTLDNNDDDDIMIVAEVHADILVESVVKKENDELTIDDDDDPVRESDTSTTVMTSSVLSSGNPSILRYNLNERKRFRKILFIPTKGTIAEIAKNPQNNVLLSGMHLDISTQPGKRFKVHENQGPSTASASRYTQSRWSSLYMVCGDNRITYLDAIYWKWRAPYMYYDTPNNLALLLSNHCTNLKELQFLSNCSSYSTFTAPLNLPNLKVIRIRQGCHQEVINDTLKCKVLNYGSQLRDIIIATQGGLEVIEFFYLNESSINVLLDYLQKLTYQELKGLKSIVLKNENTAMKALILKHDVCEQLSKLSCLELEELHLDFWLDENVKIPFEAILNRFPKLQKLIVTGCFVTTMKNGPKIILTFPVLKELVELEMGYSEVSVPVFETLDTRPPKRKERGVVRSEDVHGPRTEGDNRPSGSGYGGEDQEVNSHGRYFPVTLNLPQLPKLKKLTLGRLYEIEEVHFRRMPSLTSFRVSSPWHLSVKFPPESSRHKTFPSITEVQLPDGLQDDSFVRLVMPHFPNVEACWINLPTVKVLRAFAFIMKDAQSFKKLEVAVQFDFASSLDAVVLAKPSEIVPSEEEQRNIASLKEYEFWKEYVKSHQIDVPVYGAEAAENLEDDHKYAGICVLNEKLEEYESFVIRHVPRTLRLPVGDLHWNDDNCQFSEILIGFYGFPFSEAAWNAGPQGISSYDFDYTAVDFELGPRPRVVANIRLDSNTEMNFRKKENDDDN